MATPTRNINDFKELETPVRYIVEIRIRYWRDCYGNNYCSGRMLVNDSTVHVEPMRYGSRGQLANSMLVLLGLESSHGARLASGVWVVVEEQLALRKVVKRFGEW